jgi:hypothetical protein
MTIRRASLCAPLICGQPEERHLSHHTIRETNPPTPSLTPATDAARRVIAEGNRKTEADRARSDNLGVAARVGMAIQGATLMAFAAEVDGGADKRAVYQASQIAISNLIQQCIGYIAAEADTSMKLSIMAALVGSASERASAGIINMSASEMNGETVTITPVGAA